jgi:hypothetical protein
MIMRFMLKVLISGVPPDCAIGPVVTQCQCSSLLSDAVVEFDSSQEHPNSLVVVGSVSHKRYRINHKLDLSEK